MERKVAGIVRWTASAGIGLAAILFLLELLRGFLPAEAFLTAITLAMASVGEEFLVVLTLFLSVGAFRLGGKGVLVRRLNASRPSAQTTIMCVDKTGTLTTGSYRLEVLLPLADHIAETDLLRFAVLACEAQARDSIEAVVVERFIESGLALTGIHREWRLMARL